MSMLQLLPNKINIKHLKTDYNKYLKDCQDYNVQQNIRQTVKTTMSNKISDRLQCPIGYNYYYYSFKYNNS